MEPCQNISVAYEKALDWVTKEESGANQASQEQSGK